MGALAVIAIILLICFYKALPFSWCIRIVFNSLLKLMEPALHDINDYDEITFRCWFSDCDWFLHMNNSMYLYYCDFGRYCWGIRLLGFKNAMQSRLLVGGVHIQYKRSIQLLQKFKLRTQVVGCDKDCLWIQQTFIANNKVYCVVLLKMIYKDKNYNTLKPRQMFELYKDRKMITPPYDENDNLHYQGYETLGEHYFETDSIILEGTECQFKSRNENITIKSTRHKEKTN